MEAYDDEKTEGWPAFKSRYTVRARNEAMMVSELQRA
jgi:hypothetical protein